MGMKQALTVVENAPLAQNSALMNYGFRSHPLRLLTFSTVHSIMLDQGLCTIARSIHARWNVHVMVGIHHPY